MSATFFFVNEELGRPEFRVKNLELRVKSSEFRVKSSEFRVQG